MFWFSPQKSFQNELIDSILSILLPIKTRQITFYRIDENAFFGAFLFLSAVIGIHRIYFRLPSSCDRNTRSKDYNLSFMGSMGCILGEGGGVWDVYARDTTCFNPARKRTTWLELKSWNEAIN